ncbi:MAG: hypothetical protein EA359_19345 [Balneolaceae bacterium]|nr:MAG: hypothetical protein EA359_19345 [Balneolaceae bacterium]
MKRALTFVIIFHCFCSLKAQYLQIGHDEYLDAIGFEDEGIVMRSILNAGLKDRFPDQDVEFYNQRSSFFSMVLLLSGVMPFHIYPLEENGIDIIHAITADIRPFSEQSLLADIAVLAEVINIETGKPDDDGFDVTVTIKAEQFLKGNAPADTLYIRQRNLSRLSDSTTRPETGNTYLFLLSSGIYLYQSASYIFRETGEAEVRRPYIGRENTFVIYRIYPFRNGRLQFSNQDFEAAKRDLRMTDRILKR